MAHIAEEIVKLDACFDLKVGNATGDMALNQGMGGGHWQRDFDNGVVLVDQFRAKLFQA